jgi:hypothetical protein
VQLWFERYYGLLAASVGPGCYDECVRVKSDVQRAVEGRVNRLHQMIIDQIIDFIKHHYYHPITSTASGEPTTGCTQLCLFVKRVGVAVRERVEESLADPLLFTLATRLLHSLLHDHIKRHTISPAAALSTLLIDTQHYAASIPRDTVPSSAHLQHLYSVCLRDLARVYVVERVEACKAALQEGGLASVDVGLLMPFISNRADCRANPKLLQQLK